MTFRKRTEVAKQAVWEMTLFLAVNWAWHAAAGTIRWSFDAGETPSLNGAPNIAAGAVSRGNGGNAALLTAASASSGYTGASGGSNAIASVEGGALSSEGSSYFQFSLTPEPGYALRLTNLSFGSRSTSTGPLAFCLRSSLDGYAADLVTGALFANSAWSRMCAAPTFLSSIAGEPVVFRIYGYNGGGGPSNWRIDDLSLEVQAVDPGAASPPGIMSVLPQSVRVGQTLTFALTITPTDGDPVMSTNVTASSGITGAWSLVGGLFRYTPMAGDLGERTFTFTATDKDGASLPMTAEVAVQDAQLPAIRMTAAEGSYAQDFNSLATNGTAVSWDNAADPLEAWYAYANATEVTTYRTGTGSGAASGLYAFGTAGSADRSLGSLAGSGATYRYAVALTNEMAAAVTNLNVSFTAEQWRTGASAATNTLVFEYCITNQVLSLSQGAWQSVGALCFNSPAVTNAAQSSGATYQSSALSTEITRLVAAGQVVLLRWSDVDDSGNDHAFGIDDLVVSWSAAVPQASPGLVMLFK